MYVYHLLVQKKFLLKRNNIYTTDTKNTGYDTYNKLITDALSSAIASNDNGTVEVSKLFDIRKSLDNLFKEDTVTFDEFREKFDDFKFRDEEAINKDFDEINNFMTSVRGVKIRGVYDTKQEAEIRAKVLQRQDQSFDVFVGQVGFWLPWDPDTNNIEDQEYLNNDLNKLVKEYKNNEAKKDMFYHEQKTQRTREAASTAERLRKKLDAKKKLEEESNKITEVQEETTESGSGTSNGASNGDGNTNSTESKSNTVIDSSKLNERVSNMTISDVGLTGTDDSNDKSTNEERMTDTINSITSEDPWLKRKREESNN